MVSMIACNSGTSKGQLGISVPEYNKNLYIARAAKDEKMLKDGIIEPGKASDFKGLQYYDPDSAYRVNANITWIEKEKVIFQTNSERSPVYYKFCSLTFHMGDSTCHLTAYTEDPDGKTGLFIPFKDKTNKQATYGGGRYIEVPYHGEKETFVLDFNLAFNPYCHYNHNYSCPLVPIENYLSVAIPVGEKKLYE
jgi:uncharacterized protein (DUF1684 family)